MHSESDRKGRLAGLMLWLRDVASLVLGISLVLFGTILLYTIYFAVRTGELAPFGRMVGIVTFVACLRILIAPPPEE
ncbi:hypothetical protein HZF05_16965 [Sphingomonas sp. CGMCC 1.13654]|uniref:Uncharacterized protein n=1 Tax=Sphingomonas chungangi TaxID=2683589 RepID=A0A838L8I8_9SPHN|nr:hypothetical protein [Sphingomonas chungangi]MBA2935773.1 hypothetical protein [Sphingomonas chungangi]MVW54464.1 hypothetical protein [Sphingomonas chungangi]